MVLEFRDAMTALERPLPAGWLRRSVFRLMHPLGATLASLAVLLAPAIWNGFPLLQYDTGGYLARWYEGYLVPSRSTTFGLFLTASESFDFWPAIIVQSGLTAWVVALFLRVFGLAGTPWRPAAVVLVLSLLTTLPWLTSILLTDIFAGLGVLAFYLLVFRSDRLRRLEKIGLFLLIAFSVASHSATFAVLLALLGAACLARIFVRAAAPIPALLQAGAAAATGAALLLTANFALSGQLAWTPGGYTIPFGRLLQDGIVGRYLKDHCPDPRLKLCPYRAELPATADEFLWDGGVFNRLGRFAGLGEEMGFIVRRSLVEYPRLHFETALTATLAQLTMAASGEGAEDKLWHTYGIIQHFLPAKMARMRAARQQHGELDFHLLNRIHVPVAAASMILIFAVFAHSVWRRRFDDLALLAATIGFAVLANAFVCGTLSGPHDRYGARIAWIATFAVLLAFARAWESYSATRAPAAPGDPLPSAPGFPLPWRERMARARIARSEIRAG